LGTDRPSDSAHHAGEKQKHFGRKKNSEKKIWEKKCRNFFQKKLSTFFSEFF
jgi:hypothetical protein